MVALPFQAWCCYWTIPFCWKESNSWHPKARFTTTLKSRTCFFLASKAGSCEWFPWSIFQAAQKLFKLKNEPWHWMTLMQITHYHPLFDCSLPSWPRGETCTATLIYIADDAAELFQKYSVCASKHPLTRQMRISALQGFAKKYMSNKLVGKNHQFLKYNAQPNWPCAIFSKKSSSLIRPLILPL